MKYRALRTFATQTRTFHEGQEYDLTPAEAESLMAESCFEEVKIPTTKTAPTRSSKKAETSVMKDVEVASDL